MEIFLLDSLFQLLSIIDEAERARKNFWLVLIGFFERESVLKVSVMMKPLF